MTARMPFGKFRGRAVAELPLDYLEWLTTIELRPRLRRAVWEALDEHGYREPPPLVRLGFLPEPVREAAVEIVTAGFRTAAQRYHPDHGGDHGAMVALTEARDALQRLLEGSP